MRMSARRRVFMLAAFTVLYVTTTARAEAPIPADIAACSREAAASTGEREDSARQWQPQTLPHRAGGANVPDPATAGPSDAPSSSNGPAGGSEAPGNAALRQEFAACLARHGYYKGYYH